MPLFIEPNAGVSPVLQVIQSAHREVNLNGYLVDDGPILRALAAAHAQGVRVEVMIEGKPYGMKSWQVQKEARRIEATGATLKYAPPRFESHGSRWAFDHGKWICSLHECEIGSPNFTYAGFGHDRDYLVVTHNAQVVQAANAVFNADWNNQYAPNWTHQVLVLSPGHSASKLLAAINQPGPIDLEFEEIGYAPEITRAIADKGKLARIIVPSSVNAEDRRILASLERYGVQVRYMPKDPLYIHAKMIVGNALAYVGSINISDVSLDHNREMGLLLNGADLGKLKAQFNQDWKMAGGGVGGLVAKAKGWLSRF